MEPSTAIAQSTSTQKHYRHCRLRMPNFEDFGAPSDLNTDYLPTYKNVLQYYFYLFESTLSDNQILHFKEFTSDVADKIIEIWTKLPIEIIKRKSILNKLNRFIDCYRNKTKHNKRSMRFYNFVVSLEEIFDISQCKCNIQIAECSCGKTTPYLRRFIVDQRNDKAFTISDYVVDQITIENNLIDPLSWNKGIVIMWTKKKDVDY